jgi:hypothetical protein
MILKTILITLLIGLIFYFSFRSSSPDYRFKTKEEMFKAIYEARRKSKLIIKKENRENKSLYEYWRETDKKQIKYERHVNSFTKLKNLKKQINLIELDIKTTMQGLKLQYVILQNPLSKLPASDHPKVFPKLNKWLDLYLKIYKNKKKPALKLNIFTRSQSIFNILKEYKIDQMGIPIWIGTRGKSIKI